MVCLFVCITYRNGNAQSGFHLPDEFERNAIDKLETQNEKLFQFHTGILPFKKRTLALEIWNTLNNPEAPIENHNKNLLYQYPDVFLSDPAIDSLLKIDTKPLWKYFYRDGRHFYSHYDDHFSFTVDQVLQLGLGKENDSKDPLYLNQRGLLFNANIDQKFSARFFILETQLSALNYVNEYEQLYAAFPGAGLYKPYKGKIIKLKKGFDYLLSEGELSYDASKHVNISLGHGKHFIGHGSRSLFLSDFSTPYFYLKLQTNLWRFHYQNIYAELSSETLQDRGNRLLRKKYMAAHVLSANITKRWSFGLFESVVFGRENQFEFQYLNPVILYRFVEQSLGSPDNAFLGLQSKYLINKSMQLYGQIVFDELLVKEFVKLSGWWGNKYGMQLGIKYFDVLKVKDLDMFLEWNLVRPYTYTFRDSIANYSHFHQALAHPLGANFSEAILNITYKVSDKMQLKFSSLYFQKGLDADTLNFGGNILKDYDSRISDTDNFLFQGEKQKVLHLKLEGTYQILPQSWFDIGIYMRNENLNAYKRTFVWFHLGFRMTISRQTFDF
ncbi:MAG: hypothetical protein IPM92_13460 [Saprospiraceae bacterium]|nr:hypothetical protein [Saprospiraceae bacterium]